MPRCECGAKLAHFENPPRDVCTNPKQHKTWETEEARKKGPKSRKGKPFPGRRD